MSFLVGITGLIIPQKALGFSGTPYLGSSPFAHIILETKIKGHRLMSFLVGITGLIIPQKALGFSGTPYLGSSPFAHI
ncbi:MAG: hypothetical protein PHW77_08745, partial [Eubacteriales bacterium]|nr:hypothetical protein [Eubacteriales bacterium]